MWPVFKFNIVFLLIKIVYYIHFDVIFNICKIYVKKIGNDLKQTILNGPTLMITNLGMDGFH
jgi:hypothetical protein